MHRNSFVIDAHCDTLLHLMKDSIYRVRMEKKRRNFFERSDEGHVDLLRLKEGGVDLQIFAAFISPMYYSTSVTRALQMIDTFYKMVDESTEVGHVTNYRKIKENQERGNISALLFFEGGEAIDGGYVGNEPDLRVLDVMYRLGVRGITLTWNFRNKIGDGVREEGMGGGLTNFGRAVVERMNNLGMIVDVSHLSPSSFWDVLEVSKSPVIASHSNCRSLSDVARNLNDDQIKVLAEKNGVIGMNFAPSFLNKEKVKSGEQPTVKDVVDHIDHIRDIAGVEYVGLGSDFDGIGSAPAGLEDVSKLPNLTEELLSRGYSQRDVQKVLGENFLRVFHEVLS
ncbi:MAG: membrane dipeptidase [Candidatus Korarchaeota archaeon]|nr:membrane dipeptidase [Candidatus Korarchaeota archaeon]NIU84245.1 membrane dipeptidase [Candidatus Thorarchaeota archaeon]NIW14408.1 membrane dipeptidase [Candidatus Thorarchaeota archaeon]NIW52477.1 membrane dipeptidase [Candidatus Korarchaeota archaeon]